MSLDDVELAVFSPAGLSDALDGSHVFEGACSNLQNLIPDPRTLNLWVCRPAWTSIQTFGSFSNPGFVSCGYIIGTVFYGLIASSRNAGKDEPFAYDLEAGTFITVSNITNINTPSSPSTNGTWSPPSMDLVGPYLVVAHPGFSGAGGIMFGWFDLTNPATPVWNAGNVSVSSTGGALLTPATAVKTYKGRLHIASGYADFITDPLTLNISDSGHILTFDNRIPITAFGIISYVNVVSGGTISSLIVFKDLSGVYQVTGDFVTSNLTIDRLNFAVGTDSPLSITDSPMGLGFVSPDGMRFFDSSGHATPPLGVGGQGVNFPFLSALTPTRIVAASNASVIRLSLQNAAKNGQPFEEYWYHIPLQRWSGPHTSAASLILPYRNKFVMAPQGVLHTLAFSEINPTTTTVYTENGTQLVWNMYTTVINNLGNTEGINFNEMTIDMAIDPAMGSWTAFAVNSNNIQYDLEVTTVSGIGISFWDAAIWDIGVWDGVSTGLVPRRIQWSTPIVTSRAQINLTGGSGGGVIIGDLKYKKETLSYVPDPAV